MATLPDDAIEYMQDEMIAPLRSSVSEEDRGMFRSLSGEEFLASYDPMPTTPEENASLDVTVVSGSFENVTGDLGGQDALMPAMVGVGFRDGADILYDYAPMEIADSLGPDARQALWTCDMLMVSDPCRGDLFLETRQNGSGLVITGGGARALHPRAGRQCLGGLLYPEGRVVARGRRLQPEARGASSRISDRDRPRR